MPLLTAQRCKSESVISSDWQDDIGSQPAWDDSLKIQARNQTASLTHASVAHLLDHGVGSREHPGAILVVHKRVEPLLFLGFLEPVWVRKENTRH